MSQPIPWSLPPGWHQKLSSRGKLYYWHESRPDATQWTPPNWDAVVAANYADSLRPSPESESFRALQNWIKSSLLFCHLWSNPVASVLDLACGKGGDAGKVPSEIHYTGVDLCEAALVEARRRHPDKSFLQLSFNDDKELPKADACFCMFALHYAQDLRAVLRRVRAALPPGGVFLFITMDETACRKTPKGRGPLRIDRWEERAEVPTTRLWLSMAGTLNATPETLLDEAYIREAAAASQFSIDLHCGVVEALHQAGLGQVLEPGDPRIPVRDALYAIRDRCYAKWAPTWGTEVWHFADLYKVVVLRAQSGPSSAAL